MRTVQLHLTALLAVWERRDLSWTATSICRAAATLWKTSQILCPLTCPTLRDVNLSRIANALAEKLHAVQLTELKALLGCVGETKFVMGCISQLQDGRYFLEDLSDALPIDLSEAQTTSGFFTG